jgi:chromosome segregation ATPase
VSQSTEDYLEGAVAASQSEVARLHAELGSAYTRATTAEQELAEAEAEIDTWKLAKQGADARAATYEQDWLKSKYEFGHETAKLRAEIAQLRDTLIRAQTFIVDWTEWKSDGDRYSNERHAALLPREDRK